MWRSKSRLLFTGKLTLSRGLSFLKSFLLAFRRRRHSALARSVREACAIGHLPSRMSRANSNLAQRLHYVRKAIGTAHRAFRGKRAFNRRNPLISNDALLRVSDYLHLSLFFKAFQCVVKWYQFLFVLGKVESNAHQLIPKLGNRKRSTGQLESHPNAVREFHSQGQPFIERHIGRKFIAGFFGNDSQAINDAFPLNDLFVDSGAFGNELIQLRSCFCEGVLDRVRHRRNYA